MLRTASPPAGWSPARRRNGRSGASSGRIWRLTSKSTSVRPHDGRCERAEERPVSSERESATRLDAHLDPELVRTCPSSSHDRPDDVIVVRNAKSPMEPADAFELLVGLILDSRRDTHTQPAV